MVALAHGLDNSVFSDHSKHGTASASCEDFTTVGPFLANGDPPDDVEIIDSNLRAVLVGTTFLWSTMFNDYIGLEYGLGLGVGVAELSHRGPEFEKVQAETTSLLRSLLGLGAEHEVLFFQGGATMQFAQIPLAFLKTGQSAAYVEMGTWGEKAIAEATKAAAFHGATIETLAIPRRKSRLRS